MDESVIRYRWRKTVEDGSDRVPVRQEESRPAECSADAS